MSGITTDNASDMTLAMSKLNDQMNALNGTNRHAHDFYVRFLAHIVNLAVNDAFELIEKESFQSALFSALFDSL